MTPFKVESCEVGYSTVYDGYMVWYIVGFGVRYNHFNILWLLYLCDYFYDMMCIYFMLNFML